MNTFILGYAFILALSLFIFYSIFWGVLFLFYYRIWPRIQPKFKTLLKKIECI